MYVAFARVMCETQAEGHVAGVGDGGQAILECAALLVPDVSIDTLERLGRWDADALAGAVDEAIVAGILAGDGTGLRFAHPVIRNACLRRIGPLARARTHAEIASVLRSADSGSSER